MGVAAIIEGAVVAVCDRSAVIADETPLADLIVAPQCIEGLADVRPIARGDEALKDEGKLLAPGVQLQRAGGTRTAQDLGDLSQHELRSAQGPAFYRRPQAHLGAQPPRHL